VCGGVVVVVVVVVVVLNQWLPHTNSTDLEQHKQHMEAISKLTAESLGKKKKKK
jgi:hypothetical protein